MDWLINKMEIVQDDVIKTTIYIVKNIICPDLLLMESYFNLIMPFIKN